MPSQIRKFIFYASIFIGILSAFSISLYIYGSRPTFPADFTVAGWRVGGMPYDKFQQEYEKRLQLLSSYPVQLQSSRSNIPNKQLALGQLGVQYQKDEP